jgi:hypothetical protein
MAPVRFYAIFIDQDFCRSKSGRRLEPAAGERVFISLGQR